MISNRASGLIDKSLPNSQLTCGLFYPALLRFAEYDKIDRSAGVFLLAARFLGSRLSHIDVYGVLFPLG